MYNLPDYVRPPGIEKFWFQHVRLGFQPQSVEHFQLDELFFTQKLMITYLSVRYSPTGKIIVSPAFNMGTSSGQMALYLTVIAFSF